MSRELPILFNTDMVRAILDGRKTVTRRIVKQKYSNTNFKMRTDKYGTRLIEIENDVEGETFGTREDGSHWQKLRGYIEPKPPYKIGDILYVRETWQCLNPYSDKEYVYRASCDADFAADIGKWKPSIHMPKEAARIWLKVTDVRAERLQDLTEEQAEKEGVGDLFLEDVAFGEDKYPNITDNGYSGAIKTQFAYLWDSTCKKSLQVNEWSTNPWVWVIEFERCEKPIVQTQ